MEEKFVPVAGRIGSQRHLAAIRDGFTGVMPIISSRTGSFDYSRLFTIKWTINRIKGKINIISD